MPAARRRQVLGRRSSERARSSPVTNRPWLHKPRAIGCWYMAYGVRDQADPSIEAQAATHTAISPTYCLGDHPSASKFSPQFLQEYNPDKMPPKSNLAKAVPERNSLVGHTAAWELSHLELFDRGKHVIHIGR